jgi:cell division protein ZapA
MTLVLMSPPKTTPPAAPTPTIDVNILGSVYKVACADGEEHALNEAVVYLDKQMREIRDRGKVTGIDRIAVMAALNIANDLLRERRAPRAMVDGVVDGDAVRRRIQAMQSAIEQTLAGQEKLF